MRELEKDDHGIAERTGGIVVDGLYVPPIGLFGFRNIGDVWKHDPDDCTIGGCTSCRAPSMHQPNEGESMSDNLYQNDGNGKYEPQEDDHVVDDVDTSVPQPVENAPEQPQSDDEDVEEGGEMNHMDNSGEVVGRLNKDLPTENLSVPDATS